MRKLSVILLYLIGVLLTIFVLISNNNFVQIAPGQFLTLINIYSGISFVIITLFLIFIFKLEKQEPKTEVKIIYKTIDKQKEEEAKKKKEEKILEKYVNQALKELDQKFENAEKFGEKLLGNFAKTFDIVQGLFFLWNKEKQVFESVANFAYYTEKTKKQFAIGEGITGQVAKNKKFLYIDNVPENYIIVYSGLGSSSPKYLTFVPVVHNDRTIAVIEFANFSPLPEPTEDIFKTIANKLAPKIVKFIEN